MARQKNTLVKVIWKERLAMVGDFLKSGVIGWIICFVALGFYLASNIVIDGWDQQLQVRFQEVNSLSASLNEILVKNQHANDSVKYALTSIDTERAAKDNKIFDDAMALAFNWTKDDYDAVWTLVHDRYNLNDDVARIIYQYAVNWSKYNRNPDVELWSKYVSSRSFVRNYASDTYVYLAELKAQQQSPSAGFEDMHFVLTYSVNRDGVLRVINMQRIDSSK